MDVVFALVGVSVVLVIAIAVVLLWAVRSGQFEDMEGPAWRVIMDDDRPREHGDSSDQPHSMTHGAPQPGADSGNDGLQQPDSGPGELTERE